MTENQKREQKAALLLEYQEAADELANLRERAGRLSGYIGDVEAWVNRAQLLLGNRPYDEKDLSLDAKIRANSERYRSALNFDDALDLMDEIVAAKKQLNELAERKSELGLK